jgi:calcineurin-like phosphoesterase family protein
MTDFIIEAHNAIAQRSTDVWIVGDFALGKNTAEMRRIFDKMNGRKHLIIGNHDKKEVLRLPWSSEPKYRHTVEDNGRNIFLDHLCSRSWPGMYRGHYHFYGHTHGRLPSHGRSMDIGIDSWGYAPIRADEAIERMKEWNSDFDTYAPERNEIITCSEENVAPGFYHPEHRDDPAYDALVIRR